MIKNGYYYPVEMYKHLKRIEGGEIVGDAQIGICFGNRTGGKTVGHGIKMIQNFTERNETFVLLARTDKQKNAKYLDRWLRNKIFNVRDSEGIIERFVKNSDIKIDNNIALVNDEPFCYCEAISMSHEVKDSGSYCNATTVIMDECVQIGERVLTINGRPAMQRIFEILQTVARGRLHAIDTTNLVFIANVSDRDNWLFNDLGINRFIRNDTKSTCQNGIYVEIVMNEHAKEEVARSTIGKIMVNSVSGKEYYEAAQNNEYQDNKAFVERVGLDFTRLLVQIAIEGRYLGVFRNPNSFHIAIIERDERSETYTRSIRMHDENTKLDYNGGWGDLLYKYYEKGICTFQTLEAKGMFLEYIGVK